VAEHHRAPFDFVADLFFERVKNAVGFANRAGGKTMAVACLNLLDMLFKPGCEVASCGAILEQANRAYQYFTHFLERPFFKRFAAQYQKTTGQAFVVRSIQSQTVFANGSTMTILTGSERGLRSPHPHKFRLDEIDLMEWSLLQTALSMARSSDTVKGQNVFTSTRQTEYGSMQRLLDEAPAKGIVVYEWNAFESVERCPRRCLNDRKHGTCPIYSFCRGKAHESHGYFKVEDFIDKVRLLDRHTFEVEWLNTKPARHRLVFPMFDNTRHILTPEKLLRMTGFPSVQPGWKVFSGIDFGCAPGHPTVYVKIAALPTGAFLLFHEYYAEQRLLVDHANAIKASPHYVPGERIYADHAAQECLELKALGVRTQPANKEVLAGIDYVKTLLSGFPPDERPQLYVWYECTNTIREFSTYAWRVGHDGKPDRTGLPEKLNDHSADAARYALVSERNHVPRKYRWRTIKGI
jgi:hypothetical protein